MRKVFLVISLLTIKRFLMYTTLQNIAQDFVKRQKKDLLLNFQWILGLKKYESFLKKIKNSGININTMNNQQLRDLLNTKLVQEKIERKQFGLDMLKKGLEPIHQTSIDFNKAIGGALAVRFPALPRVVIVRQQPEYIKVKII